MEDHSQNQQRMVIDEAFMERARLTATERHAARLSLFRRLRNLGAAAVVATSATLGIPALLHDQLPVPAEIPLIIGDSLAMGLAIGSVIRINDEQPRPRVR